MLFGRKLGLHWLDGAVQLFSFFQFSYSSFSKTLQSASLLQGWALFKIREAFLVLPFTLHLLLWNPLKHWATKSSTNTHLPSWLQLTGLNITDASSAANVHVMCCLCCSVDPSNTFVCNAAQVFAYTYLSVVTSDLCPRAQREYIWSVLLCCKERGSLLLSTTGGPRCLETRASCSMFHSTLTFLWVEWERWVCPSRWLF